MSDLKIHWMNVIVVAQVLMIFVVISVSLFNLTRSAENKDLWVSLLSSSVGYLLPSPLLSKHVRDSAQ